MDNMKDYNGWKERLTTREKIERCANKKIPWDKCFSIETALYEKDIWVGGSEINLTTVSQTKVCSAYPTNKRYKTRREALKAECKSVRDFLEAHIKVNDGILNVMVDSGARKLLKMLDDIEKPQAIQLELF